MIFLDTEACLAVLKGKPGIRVVIDSLKQSLAITTPVLFEIYAGTEYYKKKGLIDKEVKFLSQIYKFKIFSFDLPAAQKAAEIWANLKVSGAMVNVMDILIGAIILQNNFKDIITNDQHFEKIEGLIIHKYKF